MAESGLRQTLHGHMVAAMKSGNKPRLSALRMIISEVQVQETDHPELDPKLAVSAYAKKLRKTLAEMEKLAQTAQVEQLKAEIAIVEEFMPKQMDDAALEALVNQTLADMPGVTAKESGKVIGAVMKAAAGTADAAKVRNLVAAKLK